MEDTTSVRPNETASLLVERLEAGRADLVNRFRQSLRETIFTNRFEMRPGEVGDIAAAEADNDARQQLPDGPPAARLRFPRVQLRRVVRRGFRYAGHGLAAPGDIADDREQPLHAGEQWVEQVLLRDVGGMCARGRIARKRSAGPPLLALQRQHAREALE